MVEPIGYAPLQIIPVLKDVSAQIDKQLGGNIVLSGKRAGAQFGKGVADGLKATESDVKRATDAYGKLADKAKDSLGQIAVAEAKLEKARAGGKTDMIVAAEERLAKVRRDSLRTSKEAEAAHSALIAMQGRLGSSTDDLGGKFSGLSGMASSAGTALLSVGTLAGGAALVGITAFAAGAVRATKELYDLGSSFDDLRDKLQISTGASGAQLEGLVATVERLGTTNVASKFGDIGDVAADVTRNLHLTGPALDDVTSRLANWDRMTGDAVNVRELGKAFRGFGVDAADQAGALDSLAGMSQATGLSVNELIGAVNKGAPALREFGFSFGESAALVGQLDAAGLNAEKMLKGPLNTALVQLRKEGKTGADGLKGIVDQIQALLKAGDQLGARGLAEKYFGKKGATDFFDAIRSGNLDLQNLSTTLAATGTDINKLAQDTGDGAERFQLLRNRIEDALKPLGKTVFDSVNDGLDQLAGWVESHQAQIIDAFVKLGDTVVAFGANSLLGIGQTIEAIGDLGAALGDAYAISQRIYAAGQDLLGRHDEAKAAREGADAAEDWGENLRNLGRGMQDTAKKSDAWKTSLHGLGEEAKKAAAATDALNQAAAAIAAAPSPGWFGQPAGQLSLSGAAAAPGASTTLTPAQLTNPALTPAPAGNMQAFDAALLANVPAGRYTQEARGDLTAGLADCSSAVEDLVNIMDNRPTTGASMWTGNEAEWLTAHGFQPGMGGPGDFRVGFNAGHTQATLPGGTPFNWGSDAAAAKRGIGGTGADDPAFTSHFFRRVAAGLALAPGPSAPGLSTLAGPAVSSPIDLSRNTLGAAGPGMPGFDDEGKAGFWKADPKAVREADERASDAVARIADADQAVALALARINELDADASESQKLSAQESLRKAREDTGKARREAQDAQADAAEAKKGKFTAEKEATKSSSKGFGGLPSLTSFSGIGSALGEFAGGQIGSALDVFGVGDSPGWLQGIGQLMGGISIGGGGDSLSPLSAGRGGGPVPNLGGAHGGTGAQPGPAGVTYNIQNGGGNDDLITLLRRREQELSAMLGRF